MLGRRKAETLVIRGKGCPWGIDRILMDRECGRLRSLAAVEVVVGRRDGGRVGGRGDRVEGGGGDG